jgi:hypothetical protein
MVEPVHAVGNSTYACPPLEACQFFYDCKGCEAARAAGGRLLRVLFLWLRAAPFDPAIPQSKFKLPHHSGFGNDRFDCA